MGRGHHPGAAQQDGDGGGDEGDGPWRLQGEEQPRGPGLGRIPRAHHHAGNGGKVEKVKKTDVLHFLFYVYRQVFLSCVLLACELAMGLKMRRHWSEVVPFTFLY